jgi:hypothetical protein
MQTTMSMRQHPGRAIALTVTVMLAVLAFAAVAARPAHAAKVTTGWVTGTVYFNKSETKDMKSVANVAPICGALAPVAPPAGAIAAAACAFDFGAVAFQANRAENRNMCAKIKFTLTPPPATAWWPDIYSGDHCT